MKYKYSVNSKNQLLIKPPGYRAGIPVNGRLSVNKENKLIYRLNEPQSWRKKYNVPAQISFTGNWKLNSNYDLELNLDETKSQFQGDRLILKGEIISCDSDTLSFEIIGQDRQGLIHAQILKLTGSWRTDDFNRIIFMIEKKATPDVITLEGAWQINKNQQLAYTYEKTLLKRKTRVYRTLIFEGFWQINSSSRLTYIILYSSKSRFDFRVQIESPNLYPQEGAIKYRIGIGLKETKPYRMKIISLYGSWKFSRKAGLNFQVDYGNGRFKEIEFGANFYLTKKNAITLFLANKREEPLGLNITFTHSFLGQHDAQAFLGLKNFLEREETAIQAGVRIPF